ncbi:MAG: ImmA/IrrE family metallo-endopeptidase [Janthinobacterium lividum]
MKIITQIEEQAKRILLDCGAFCLPIPVEKVAEYLGLKIEKSVMDSKMSGVLVVENRRGAIACNQSHAHVRQRFTIGHEIGHFILHVNKSTQSRLFIDQYVAYRRNDQSSGINDVEEGQANAFSAALLMPADLVMEEIIKNDYDLDDEEDQKALAKRFNVSAPAMSIRLVHLGLLR